LCKVDAVTADLLKIAGTSDEQKPDCWLDIATAPEKEDSDWFIGTEDQETTHSATTTGETK
jgi:hypothetical protein